MATRDSDRAAARRRARLAARGRPADDEEPIEPEPEVAPRGGFLSRFFPPAPPLPGRPPPLAGFEYQGPLRAVVERLWLLRRGLLVWLPLAAAFAVGFLTDRQSGIGFFLSFITFAAPIAAGWFGWRRPPLYGAATAFVGYLLATILVVAFFTSQGLSIDDLGGPATFAGYQSLQLALYTVMGYALGLYGGYLRRRQAAVQEARAPRRQRR
jgi:hypothetical protein